MVIFGRSYHKSQKLFNCKILSFCFESYKFWKHPLLPLRIIFAWANTDEKIEALAIVGGVGWADSGGGGGEGKNQSGLK